MTLPPRCVASILRFSETPRCLVASCRRIDSSLIKRCRCAGVSFTLPLSTVQAASAIAFRSSLLAFFNTNFLVLGEHAPRYCKSPRHFFIRLLIIFDALNPTRYLERLLWNGILTTLVALVFIGFYVRRRIWGTSRVCHYELLAHHWCPNDDRKIGN